MGTSVKGDFYVEDTESTTKLLHVRDSDNSIVIRGPAYVSDGNSLSVDADISAGGKISAGGRIDATGGMSAGGNVDVSGALTIGNGASIIGGLSASADISAGGRLTASSTEDSSNFSSGALRVSGGGYIGKNLRIGANLYLNDMYSPGNYHRILGGVIAAIEFNTNCDIINKTDNISGITRVSQGLYQIAFSNSADATIALTSFAIGTYVRGTQERNNWDVVKEWGVIMNPFLDTIRNPPSNSAVVVTLDNNEDFNYEDPTYIARVVFLR
jgi:hypothetical protein